MKRVASILVCFVLLCTLALPAYAAQLPYVSIDAALTDSDAATITEIEQNIEDSYGFEVAFLLDGAKAGGEDFQTDVRTFMYEATQSPDALVFGVSADSYYIYGIGKANQYFTSDDADTLYAAIRDADESGDAASAAVLFYQAVNKLAAKRAKTLNSSAAISKTISTVRFARLEDQADLLTTQEESAMLAKLDEISERQQFDVVVVTTQSTAGKTPEAFADDYFDYNGFGFGDSKDGCLLLVSMAERDWHVSTSGFGETAMDEDYSRSYLSMAGFNSALSGGDYSEAFNIFADFADDFVTEAKTNKPYSRHHRVNDAKNKAVGALVSLLIGMVIAAIITVSKKHSYTKAVHKQENAGQYLVPGSLVLREERDQFLYTNVTRTAKPKDTDSHSGGGGYSSGHHTSSSGSSHGGFGGKF